MDDAPDPPKRKRNDVAERKKKNKDLEYSCVKCSWNTLCKNKEFDNDIQNIILNINKISFLSYKLLNFHVIRLIEENKEIPEITQNLFYNCCCMVSKFQNRKNKINEEDELYISFSKFKDYIDELPFRDKMCNLINNLNKQQETVSFNHLKLNFYKRLKKYLELKTGEKRGNILYNWLKDIYEEEYKGHNFFIHHIRKWLKYVPTETNIKKHSSHFIKIYYHILRTFEKFPNTKKVRTFSLLPNKNSFTMSNIEICNKSLADIISYIINEKVNPDFMDKKRDYWINLFNIEKFETQNRKFSYTILTDGKSAVIQLEKPKKNKIKDYKGIEYEQYVGIDPGIRSLVTSYNDKDETLQMTTKQYRHESKMIYGCKKRESWYKKWDNYEYWKNIPSFKVSKTKNMLKYFEYVLPKIDDLFRFHVKHNFRGLKFKSYCRSKATLTKICKNIKKDKKTIIGFGDFSQQQGLVKKHPTTPILKIKKELNKYCDVIEINEYNTSKTCHLCHQEVKLYKNRILKDKIDKVMILSHNGICMNIKHKMSNVHGVIRCINNECKLCCMDRDVNASKNILDLLLLQLNNKKRPVCFLPKKSKNNCDTHMQISS